MRQARSRKMLPRRARRSKKMSLAGMKALVRNKKRFKASSGKYAQVAVLDANTASFGSDLLKVFTENVAKARKENMRLFGSPDRAPENH
jgi:hypothetical protein